MLGRIVNVDGRVGLTVAVKTVDGAEKVAVRIFGEAAGDVVEDHDPAKLVTWAGQPIVAPPATTGVATVTA